jgi:hypothetical protein
MAQVQSAGTATIPEARWKDMYRLGGVFCLIGLAVVVLAIIAFVIWPYTPGVASAEEVFAILQSDLVGGIMSLDFFFVLGTMVSIPILVALYAALKRANESYALLALILGLTGAIALIPSRPIVEMVNLSDLYAGAATVAAKSQYVAAGEALLTLFNGTAWVMNIVLVSVSYVISSLLMLRSGIFGKATAYVGLITNVMALCFFLPVVGTPLLLLATVGGAAWLVQLARGFFELARRAA